MYTGKVDNIRELNLGEKVVKRLSNDLRGNHHCMYIDNYFVSYNLIADLKHEQINACGTVNADRKNLPKFKETKTMSRGDSQWFTSTDGIMAIKWIDNKAVHVLSNFHDPKEIVQVKRKQKSGEKINVSCPAVIYDYNQNMNCVDRFDQLKAVYEMDRKSKKWWHRIFFYFVDAAIVNSYVLHKYLPVTRLDLKTFRRRIVFGLVSSKIGETNPHGPKPNKSQLPTSNRCKPKIPQEIRHSKSRHHPKSSTRRRCALCRTKKKCVQTSWMCTVCNVPLCINKNRDCFQKFHN